MVTFHSIQVSLECKSNPSLPKVCAQHYIIWNVPWPCLSSWQRLHHWPKHPRHHFLPPSATFMLIEKKKKSLIWCDATNPNATNHRSRPPRSTQTPVTPPPATSRLPQVRLGLLYWCVYFTLFSFLGCSSSGSRCSWTVSDSDQEQNSCGYLSACDSQTKCSCCISRCLSVKSNQSEGCSLLLSRCIMGLTLRVQSGLPTEPNKNPQNASAHCTAALDLLHGL